MNSKLLLLFQLLLLGIIWYFLILPDIICLRLPVIFLINVSGTYRSFHINFISSLKFYDQLLTIFILNTIFLAIYNFTSKCT